MAQVDFLLPTSAFEFQHHSNIDDMITRTHYLPITRNWGVPLDDDGMGASSLPTPPLELEHIDHSVSAPAVNIPGLPALSSCSPVALLRSRILQAAVDAEANQPNAERAFFIADLSQVYKQFERWKRCLPNVEPFYGQLFIYRCLTLSPTYSKHPSRKV